MMRWTVPLAMLPADRLLRLARHVDSLGYHSIALPDSVFYPESVSANYPYSADGSRFWEPETPFIDPFVAIPAMAAVTDQVCFITNVLKVPLRNPLLLAKQISSVAVLSGNRFALGAGLSWMPEEFAYCGTDKRTRGKRTDEAIEIVRLVCAGNGPEWVEYHGDHYDFDRLMVSPAPDKPVRILSGGSSEPALARAARLCDGWISVQSTFEEIGHAIESLKRLRHSFGGEAEPFEINALCTEAYDLDTFRRLADLGVTEAQVAPWYFYGGDHNDPQVQLDALTRFADEVVHEF